jgi:DNA-binding GntR family transcriptional regulator
VGASRGAANNADYRDLVRASLMVDAAYLILAMMREYRLRNQVMRSYDQHRKRLDAIYAGDVLRRPLKGMLLVRY